MPVLFIAIETTIPFHLVFDLFQSIIYLQRFFARVSSEKLLRRTPKMMSVALPLMVVNRVKISSVDDASMIKYLQIISEIFQCSSHQRRYHADYQMLLHIYSTFSHSLSCIHAHFPYMHTQFSSPIGLKPLQLFIDIFRSPPPHNVFFASSLYQCRDENCRRTTVHTHTNSHWLLADTTAIKHEHTSAIIFHFHFGSLFSPFAWRIFEWVATLAVHFFALSCLAKSLIDCERWP